MTGLSKMLHKVMNNPSLNVARLTLLVG